MLAPGLPNMLTFLVGVERDGGVDVVDFDVDVEAVEVVDVVVEVADVVEVVEVVDIAGFVGVVVVIDGLALLPSFLSTLLSCLSI